MAIGGRYIVSPATGDIACYLLIRDNAWCSFYGEFYGPRLIHNVVVVLYPGNSAHNAVLMKQYFS